MNVEVKEKKALTAFKPSLFMIRCSTFDIQGSTELSIVNCDTVWLRPQFCIKTTIPTTQGSEL